PDLDEAGRRVRDRDRRPRRAAQSDRGRGLTRLWATDAPHAPPLPACGERSAHAVRLSERLCTLRVPLTRPAFAALRRVDLSPQAGRGETRAAANPTTPCSSARDSSGSRRPA